MILENKEIWKQRMNNLIERRKTYSRSAPSTLPTYEEMLSVFTIGKTVLDVGCGDMNIKNYLSDREYVGIDAFPCSDKVIKAEIETYAPGRQFETIICFAVLDGVWSFEKVIDNIKKLCIKNIIILTGIDIEPDQYHTFKIEEKTLIEKLKPFKITFSQYLAPKLLLCEFSI